MALVSIIRLAALAVLCFSIAMGAPARAADSSPALYRLRTVADRTPMWVDGRFGPIAQFQAALRERLAAAGAPAAELPEPDGTFGPGTERAIVRLLSQPQFADLAQAVGQRPAITVDLWRRLLPDVPPPDVEQRAQTILLTYEGTPFGGVAEWNFCQSRPSSQRRTAPCESNDPTSYLTWGPHGATAGGGREIQGILIAVDAADPALIDRAFGGEAPAVRRLLRLAESRRQPFVRDAERHLCTVWMDPARAEAWARGFAALGTSQRVREIYRDLYRSRDFDGAKIAAFQRLYERLGRRPTEIDVAFFVDRAAHTSGVFADGGRANREETIAIVEQRVRSMVPNAGAAPPSHIRRALSDILATENRRNDRNGRDVVFFVDGVGMSRLTASQSANWLKRGPRHAGDAGLSDERPAALAVTSASFPTLIQPRQTLSASEAARCPAFVMNWVNPDTGRTRDPSVR